MSFDGVPDHESSYFLAKFDRWPFDSSSLRFDHHFEYGILSTYATRHNRKEVSEFVVHLIFETTS